MEKSMNDFKVMEEIKIVDLFSNINVHQLLVQIGAISNIKRADITT